MTQQDNDIEERKKLHEGYRNELLKRQLSNDERFDRAILTYSSAGLAISLTFLKDFIPIPYVAFLGALYASWACFVFAIILIIASYPAGQRGIKKQLDLAEDYYQKNIQDAYGAKNMAGNCAYWMGLGAGILFIFAVILTTVFVCLNLDRNIDMVGFKSPELRNAAGIPKMQQFGTDAASIPRMQAVPNSTPTNATPPKVTATAPSAVPPLQSPNPVAAAPSKRAE